MASVCGKGQGALGGSEEGPCTLHSGDESSCWISDGDTRGGSFLDGGCFYVGDLCYKNIVVPCCWFFGFDGLAAAPGSPCCSVLVGHHFERSQGKGGAVAMEVEEGESGGLGMGFQVVHRSSGVDTRSLVGVNPASGR